MQRLARNELSVEQQNALLFLRHYQEIKLFLAHHLPPSTVSLFAEPMIKSDTLVEWYTTLQGQPVKVSEKQYQESVSMVVEQKLNAIKNLTSELKSRGELPSEKEVLIQKLLNSVQNGTKQVYLVNNDPVLIGWGINLVTKPESMLVSSGRSHLCCWLVSLLLLLFLLVMLWCFYFKPVDNPVIQESEPKVLDEKLLPQPNNVVVDVVEVPKIAETVETENLPIVEQEQLDELPDTITVPSVKAVQCTKSIIPAKRPQMVIIFDNSGSMMFSLSESNESIHQFVQKMEYDGFSEDEMDYMTREPKRISVAKSSAAAIVDKIDKEIDIGLVSLTYCPSQSHGFYAPNKRKALKKKIESMYPDLDKSGTALYDGLLKAASMIDGKNREAFILLISDGEDSCTPERNICSLAKSLANRKPKLKINVVDIGNTKAANCVANATKGTVFTASNKEQLINMINNAIEPMVEKEECNTL